MPTDGSSQAHTLPELAAEGAVGLLSVVSLTWRDAPGAVRGRLATPVEEDERRSLKRQGARGMAEVHTCARSTWIFSATEPGWVGALWQAQTARRLGELYSSHDEEGRRSPLPALYVGEDAFRHVLRVAVGLESYVQGEADIGGQVGRALEAARLAHRSDVVLNQLGQSVARLVTRGRNEGFIRPNRGLGQLAVERLTRMGADLSRPVGVVGLGDIGRRVMASLRRAGGAPPVAYNRSGRGEARPLGELAAGGHEALIVCTAGPEGWFEPPPGVRLLVDLGVPRQVGRYAGVRVGMDALLAGDPLCLPDERLRLSASAVEEELGDLFERLRSVQVRRGLEGMNMLRDTFLAEELTALLGDALDGLPLERRRRLVRAAESAIRRYNHLVLNQVKQELTPVDEPR